LAVHTATFVNKHQYFGGGWMNVKMNGECLYEHVRWTTHWILFHEPIVMNQ